jgi:hypothetical protein
MRIAIILLCAAAAVVVLCEAETAAGLVWTAPAGWTSKGASTMRAATYDVGDAECVAYFLGEGQGGSVEANMARWKGQFTVGGQPAPAKTEKKTIHGLTATTLDVTGAYAGMGGPNMAPLAPKADYRMLAAIIEGPGGNIFLKFTGPVKTVTVNQSKYDQLLNSFRKQ